MRRSPLSNGYRYSVYGIVLASAFPLESVMPAAASAEPSIELQLRPASYFRERVKGAPDNADDWIWHTVLDDGSVYIWVNRVLETIVSADGRSVACLQLEGADAQAFEANLLNFVLSTSFTLLGEEPLHATVVDFAGGDCGSGEFGGRAAALLGTSGAGKSTLAAFLISQGASLVTDDMLRFGFNGKSVLAYPGPHRLKLFDEPARRFLPGAAAQGHFNAISGKLLVRPGRSAAASDRPRSLEAMFFLRAPSDADGDVTVRRLEGAALAKVLLGSAMNIRYFAPDRLARQLRFAEQVGRRLPVYELAYPRGFSVMDRVGAEIRRLVGA